MMMKLSTLKFIYLCPLLVVFYDPFVVTPISQPINIKHAFPAVIVFGDSILDTGNNNYIKTIAKSNFRPYGRDFIEGKPTGRFCNGRIPSDFLVEMLGIKEVLPPYLDPDLQIEDLLTGVCFASAGSGIDPITVKLTSVLSVEHQLYMFKEYIQKLKTAVGEERTAFILEKCLFIISLGSNDIGVTYFLTPFRKTVFNIQDYTSMLVSNSSNFLQELHQLGARRIGVLGLLPLGCAPLLRTIIGGGQNRNCVESVNQAVMVFNSKLSSSIMALAKTLQDSRLVYLETYPESIEIVQHYHQFGFEVEDSACCGIANVEFGPLCNSLSLVCEDASKYVFWDGFHPSERAYSIVVSEVLKKNIEKFV